METNYRAALRDFIVRRGQPVQIDEKLRDRHPEHPDLWVSEYGWKDYRAAEHAGSCGGWVVPEGVTLNEVTYSQFTDTFHENDQTVGINVSSAGSAVIRCRCGECAGVTLRWDGSLAEAIGELIGFGGSSGMTL